MLRFIVRDWTYITLAIVVLGCGGEESTSITPSALAVSPSRLTFSDTSVIAKAYLTTTPTGGQLDWQISAKPSWLKVTPEQGRISGKIIELALDASALVQMNPGNLQGTLEFVSSGGVASIDVVGRSLENPKISVTQTPVEVAESADSTRFVVRNTGKGDVDVSVATTDSWMTTRVDRPDLQRGESTFVHVIIDKQPLPAGVTTARVLVRSFSARDSVTVPVTIRVAAAPRAVLDASRVAFLAGDQVARVVLRNTGKGALNWSVAAGAPWLFVSPLAGVVLPGDATTLVLQLDRARLTGPEQEATLTIASNAVGGAVAIPVIVTASPGFVSGLTVLGHRVIDSEASASAGLIVTVSAQPSRLNVLDVFTGSVTSVPLASVPTSVGVRPDGAFAAVGHDGSITLVDLRTRTVVRQYPVPADLLDIVLPMNGWAYGFPRSDQWTSIQNLDLATGNVNTQTNHPGIYAGTYARLHPSGTSIYGSQTQLSPADHERFDISKGVAVRLYDSRYHGDYPMGGDAWISEDGSRLFNRWAHVFRLSPNQRDDLVYAGRLSGLTDVRWVADAPAMLRVLALVNAPAAWQAQINSYNRDNLNFNGAVPLPRFPNGATTALAQGRFVFVLRNRVYALVQADANAGLLSDWGLAAIDAAQVP